MLLFRPFCELMTVRNVAKAGQNVQLLASLAALQSHCPSSPLHWLSARYRKATFVQSVPYYAVARPFLAGLAQAALCRKHGFQLKGKPPFCPRHHIRNQWSRHIGQIRHFHLRQNPLIQQLAATRQPSQEDYIELLDYYIDTPSDDVSLPSSTLLSLSKHGEERVKAISETQRGLDHSLVEQDARVVQVKAAIEDENVSLEETYSLYRALPNPRIEHLPTAYQHKLLRRFAVVEKRSEKLTIQFLSIMDDVKIAGYKLPKWAWNSAIHLAGRTMVKITASEVEDALRMWKEMEQEAGVSGNTVTFNILFDIAVKAGQFNLAEMILHEMKQRKLELTRFTRTGLIYYEGVRRNGTGIRRAYRNFVEDGEIVDTMVLNCVIASLQRAGEPAAALQVYERMKEMHTRMGGPQPPHLDWRAQRDLGRTLLKLSLRCKENPALLSSEQDKQCLAPNVKTYIILINHHATRSGELSSIVKLLEEMQTYGLPVHGRIFQELYKGFAIHGRLRYTAWTAERLKSVWEAFIKLSEEKEVKDVYVAKWIVVWILKAFAKCYGRRTTLQIWEELKLRWERTAEEEEMVLEILESNLRYIDAATIPPVNR